jgi:hypothetical protein
MTPIDDEWRQIPPVGNPKDEGAGRGGENHPHHRRQLGAGSINILLVIGGGERFTEQAFG